MDTLSFLKLVLPASGIYFGQRIRPRPGKRDATILYPVESIDELACKLIEIDAQYTTDNVFYAMASYKEAQTKTMQTKDGRDFTFNVGRTQENALNVKSLWMDLDVGKEGGYATQKEAAADLQRYLNETGMPSPMVVSSGYGLHVYWLFTDEVPASEWEGIAKLQRSAWQHLGVKADPNCDQDCARVLRAPGCVNKKNADNPKTVRVLRTTHPLPPQEFKRILKGFVDRAGLQVREKPVRDERPLWMLSQEGNVKDAATVYPDSYARIAVHHCAQLKEFYSTGGSTYDQWWQCLGLMKHFKDGQQYAHEWGCKHDRYSEDETEFKMESWRFGPTLCATFQSGESKAVCNGCKHKCGTPMQLGYDETVEKPNLLELAKKADDTAVATAHAIADSTDGVQTDADGMPVGWPEGYGYDKANDCVNGRVMDANGVWVPIKIATPLFYPVEQILDEEGTFCFRMHAWQRGKVREFMLPTKYVADARSLKMQLASQQIHVINDKATANFLSNYMVNQAKKQEETRTYRQMGWQHDFSGWLVGDTLITKKELKKVILSSKFSDERRDIFKLKGTSADWAAGVNTLYNRPNAEPYQLAICAAFAAPLHALLGLSEWRGIPYALTTDESGFGKTTVNMIANSIWYDPEKGKISNSTPKAVLGIASEFNNLPFLLDEVTSYLKDPVDMGDLLYAMSNGRGREGMGNDGGLRRNSAPWLGCCQMTGNRNILYQVTESKVNPEAQQMRVFEIDLDTYPRITTMMKGHPDYDTYYKEHNDITQRLLNECCGVVGVEYIRFIMSDLEWVKNQLVKVRTQLMAHMDGDATKERFYYNLITTVLVGGLIAKKMGLLHFDMKNLRDWCIRHVARLRGLVISTRRTPQDNFASMMADFVGRIIVTNKFETLDGRKKQAEHHLGMPLRTGVCGRYVKGDEVERTQLYVSVSAVQEWCIEKGISYNSLRREFMDFGIIKLARKDANRETGAVRIGIGKGVIDIHNLGTPWCLEFDAERAAGILDHGKPMGDVVDIKKSA